jgi:hypothetical protein
MMPDWISVRNPRASSGDSLRIIGPSAIASTNCCVRGSSNAVPGMFVGAAFSSMISIRKVALAIDRERSRDKTLTKRCEFSQNPERRRENRPMKHCEFT